MPKKIICFLFLFLFCYPPAFADDALTLEKIIVKSSQQGQVYSLQNMDGSQADADNLNAPIDLLNYSSGVDLRYRGTFGIQGDLSFRGSTYEQVAVLIDGINVMDPQTGHYNLDIPLTNFDIERMEVTKEGVSSLYGAGALAGGVNIVVKKPIKKVACADFLFGENALFGQSFSLSLPGKDYVARISVDHKIAKAARPNTDFKDSTASFYLDKDFSNFAFNTLIGYQKKDFGADSFYSNLFPEEEEHTRTFFFKAGLNPRTESGFFKNSLFLRQHKDKFILNRNKPTSVNYHTTYIYGLDSRREFVTPYGRALVGIGLGEDEISSTNLGKHSRLHEAGSLGFNTQLSDAFSLDIKGRVDHYQGWGAQESYNGGISYKINELMRLNGSLGRAFRIPSFTDLYYSDAANKGNPNLKVEKSDTYRLGYYFDMGYWGFNFDTFYRRGKNLIDYTRPTVNDVWQATNLGRIDFKGIDLNLNVRPDMDLGLAQLDRLAFSYAYTDADKKSSGFLSKYALDILKHQLLLTIDNRLLGLTFNWHFSYSQRYYGETYFLGDISISKRIKTKNFTLEPFIRIDNFSDAQYSEVGGVLEPGRWVKGGVKLEW